MLGFITDPDRLESRIRAARDPACDVLKPKHEVLAVVDEMLHKAEATCLISQAGEPRVLELKEVRGPDAGGSDCGRPESLSK